MITVISPAKNLDFETHSTTQIFSQPEFIREANVLVEICRDLSSEEICNLFSISKNLAEINTERFKSWKTPFTPDNAKQAMLAFNGDVYLGLDATRFAKKDLNFAQGHLRILSGLFGILRPLDLIQPYRLEMGTRLHNPKGSNLYQYWGISIAESINRLMENDKKRLLVNLASDEYFKAIDLDVLNADIVTPVFKDKKNGSYKVISFYAKRARGLMANFLVRERAVDEKGIRQFTGGGYQYSAAESTPTRPVFLRDLPV